MLKAIAATAGKGGFGSAACFGAAMVASIDTWINGFKLAGMIMGVLIGIVTFISISLDIAAKRRQQKDRAARP